MGIPWDGTGINCYGMGMGQINMSHGQPWDIETRLLNALCHPSMLLLVRGKVMLDPVEDIPTPDRK